MSCMSTNLERTNIRTHTHTGVYIVAAATKYFTSFLKELYKINENVSKEVECGENI